VEPATDQVDKTNKLGRLPSILPVWMRNPAGLALLIAIVFGALGISTLAIEIGRPFPGFVAYGFVGRPKIFVSQENPRWFPGITEDGLQPTDLLLTINGRPYHLYSREEISRAYAEGRSVEILTYRPSTEQVFTADITPLPFSFLNFLDLKFPEIVVATVFLMVGFIVLRARHDSPVNQTFAVATAMIAGHRLTAITSFTMDATLIPNLPRIGHLLAAGLLPPLIFHVAVLFPFPMRRKPVWAIYSLYISSIIAGSVMAMARMPFWARLPMKLGATLDDVAYRFIILMYGVATVMIFGRMIREGLHHRGGAGDRRTRRVVIIVLGGLILAFPPVFVLMAPGIPGLRWIPTSFWGALDLRYFLLAIPLAFALAIIRYHAFRGPSRLSMVVLIISLSALTASVAVGTWSFIMQSPHLTPGSPNFQVLFITILITGFFWSRQSDWRGWFGRLLRRTDQNFESARSFGNRVMSRTPLRAMPETIATALVDELDVERAAVWTYDVDAGAYELAGAAGGVDPPVPPRLVPAPGAPDPDRVIHVGWVETPIWLGRPAAEGRIEVVTPLKVNERMIGLLGVGRRWDEDIFDERDLTVVDLVGQQASLFMQASMQIEELRRVPVRVAAAQEQERYRLAGELHDTIQQFLGRLPFFLATARDKMKFDQPMSSAILDRCLDDVEEASIVLREIRANLAPNQLTNSLAGPLYNLAGYIEKHTELKVRLDLPMELDEATTVDSRHALYRVIRQATDNAVTHAKATEIDITLQLEDGRTLFLVRDDGHGVGRDELALAAARGSFGLQSMQARVKAAGGEFVFDSAEGQGTTVSGWVPSAG